ncbi:malonate--CoA ligase [Tritonibacter horizontis]|uniref:Long-chain-fatty-acid--CoA ligase n=1 Tax=Tritonibacter horizontis TaxID=1768241 RepID=A0A132BQM5_9RHOB|nr:malonyl-CoA synthase [Tritonibacter horizontis]KUP90691.1 long-chain-fatty-acid--CoA ligase [Tritonibacter horizontis]
MPNLLYDTLFGRHTNSDAPFLFRPGTQELTYRRFLAQSAQFAHALEEVGVQKGDRVAVQIPKSAEALALYAACAAKGAIFLPLNTAYTTSEVTYFVEDSGATLLVVDPERAEALQPLARSSGAQLLTLGASGEGSLPARAADKPEQYQPVDRSADDLAAFLYTSGTTGRSKGAMLTQGNLLSNAQTLVDLWRFSRDDVLLHALPIFHTHGLFVATNVMLLAGGAMILLPGFDSDAMIRNLPNATAMMGVPTFYTRLLDDPRFDRDLVAGMRLFVSGSAPLLSATHETFEARTGHRILERYGMTETNMNTSNPYDGDRRAGTVGLPLPEVELQICDPDTGAVLPSGAVGVIEVRGPNVFKGYWNMPEKTAEELRDTGFFITGDLGQLSDDGYLTIVGRSKDLIISGGYNIYPKEVEQVLDRLPGVLESAVIGAPHPDFGEGVVAVLVPKPGVEIDLDAIWAGLRDALAKYKQPKVIEVTSALPRNTMGKVQKNLLRARFDGAFTG